MMTITRNSKPRPATTREDCRVQEELGRLRQELEQLEKRGDLPEAMKGLRERVARLESRAAGAGAAGGVG